MFKFRKQEAEVSYASDPVELRFDTMMGLVKDLSRADYNRLKEAMDLGYKAYQKVRGIKTEEDEDVALEIADYTLTKEDK